jgi:predicted phosphoribosyltransferase
MFHDRLHAGSLLSEKLDKYKSENTVILAIPRGGVEVAYPVAKSLGIKINIIAVRKLPIPESPETGFGAVAYDGSIFLNEEIARIVGVTDEETKKIAADVLKEIKRRKHAYGAENPDVRHKTVIIVDDGLATGCTMIAAVRSVRKQDPEKIIVAVPVSSQDAFEAIEKEADEVICLHISRSMMFAVAGFYERFADMSDEDVMKYLG